MLDFGAASPHFRSFPSCFQALNANQVTAL